MNNEAKHTQGNMGRNIRPISKYPILFCGRNTHVAQIITRGLPEQETEANADRMVMCWNAHDDLVAALRIIADGKAMDQSTVFTHADVVLAYQEIARKTLAKLA